MDISEIAQAALIDISEIAQINMELATLIKSQGALGRSTSVFGQSRDHVRPAVVVGTELEVGRSCRQLKPDLVPAWLENAI